jgi:predicted MPP superfamily phosphohydrolase
MVLEIIYYIFKKHKSLAFLHTTGILLCMITITLLLYNDYTMQEVVQRTYELKSDKIDTLRILQITDLHMSHKMNVKQIETYCQKMNALNIDIVVLTGDIFEEKTTYQEMKEVVRILSTIKSRLGMYYIYGNHDSFSAYDEQGYTSEDIRVALEKNHISVLEDTTVTIEDITIIGRKDIGLKRDIPRKSMEELLENIDFNNYIMVLDHQPLELEKNARLGIDLELSGHTHGGYGYPLEHLYSMMNKGLVYGRKTIDDFTAITSSGISFSKRTGAPNEYVYIVINKE